MRESGVHVFDSPQALYASAAAAIGAIAAESLAARGGFTMALTGGSTAKSLFPVLASSSHLVEWVRTKVWWGDERCVPPDHEDSNYKLAWEMLLSKVPISRDAIHRMRGEDPDLDWAAQDYAKSLPDRFDLILLGMGPDGHVCSLFPGHAALKETARLVVPVGDSPKPPARRLTLTPPVIEAARHLLVVVTGAEKAGAVARALAPEGTVSETPARLAKRGLWLLSRDTAPKDQPKGQPKDQPK